MKTIKKAQTGKKVVKGSRPGIGVFRTTKERTTYGGIAEPYKYKTESIDTTGYSKGRKNYKFKTVEGESDKLGLDKVTNRTSKTVSRKDVPAKLKYLNKAQNGNNVKPDYRNIKKEKRTIKGSKEVVPTAKDSADYREGFENAVKKVRNTRIPKSSNYTRGQREAKERNLKSGGTVAKNGKWIQKATASIKRRGTEGKCTPITKPGCTGRAKALAKTFKKMAKARKK
jgi:hypothetical protein